MRRCICVFCATLILFSLCSCSRNDRTIVKPVNFYYKTDPANYQENAISPEVRESDGYTNDLKGLLQLYVEGPVSKTLINPFPENITVEGITVNNTTVDLQLNSPFAQLSDIEMTTACACLTMTVLELTERHRLIITALDHAGNIIYTTSMTKDHILLSDID